jgi:hypothetical protein
MELRTTFKIEPSREKLGYNSPAMFIGSCFASSIGSMMEQGHMPVMINPSGTVYNPVSVCNTLDTITSGKEFTIDDLYYYNDTYLSFYHYTDFSSENPSEVLEKINKRSKEAGEFLRNARFLFITLGTARVYKWIETGIVVSNCHKIPSSHFEPELLSVEEIVDLWSGELDRLNSLFPLLKIVFTISPVRHWKDGAHGNQISKSILLLAVEELLKHSVSPQYFPAYEIFMDDLRDYRFYDNDMIHPSQLGINYTWDAFTRCYMDSRTIKIWNDVARITKATMHKINTSSRIKIEKFANSILQQISEVETINPSIDFSNERDYFLNLLIK